MIRLKIEEITAGRTSPMETVFWGTDAPRVSDLLAALEPLEDAMPLGWQYRSSSICSGLWARAGAFCSAAETFVDAFDHTVFRETVWNYSCLLYTSHSPNPCPDLSFWKPPGS